LINKFKLIIYIIIINDNISYNILKLFEVVRVNRKEPDPNSLLILQDMIDIFYKISRIKDNSYDQNASKNINSIIPIDKAENLIRYMSQNTDNTTKQNADIFVNILKNIDSMNQNQYRKQRNNSNSSKNLNYDNHDVINKIKFFLKSLNDEE